MYEQQEDISQRNPRSPPPLPPSRTLFLSQGGGGGGNSALDRDFRHIIRQIPLEDKRDLILQYGDEASKRRAHNTTADGKQAGDGGAKVGGWGSGGVWTCPRTSCTGGCP